MNFRRHRRDDPEINLIPFIDILLVVIVFLVLTTTYARFTELQLTLPTADGEPPPRRPAEIVVLVGADGRTLVDRQPVDGTSPARLAAALSAAAAGKPEATVVINADATAAHQSVINVLDAARRAGLARLTFAAQSDTAGR